MRGLLIALALLASPALAHDFTHGALKIDHPWSRPAITGRPMAAFFTLSNSGPDDRLVAIEAPGFSAAELHESRAVGDVQTMQQVEAIAVPGGQDVALAPGGLHVMLFGAPRAFAPGDSFPLTLVFEKAGRVAVTVDIDAAPAEAGHHDHSGHSGHAAPAPQ